MYEPVHTQPCYKLDIYLPVTEYYSKRGLWLPSSVTITDEEVDFVCEKIREFYD